MFSALFLYIKDSLGSFLQSGLHQTPVMHWSLLRDLTNPQIQDFQPQAGHKLYRSLIFFCILCLKTQHSLNPFFYSVYNITTF